MPLFRGTKKQIMKYLLVTCRDYKGGEIGNVKIYDSIVECLNNIDYDIGDSFEDYIENKKELIWNKTIYAGGNGYCFQICPIKGDELKDELGDEEMLEAIDKITIDDYEEMKKRW